jgi:transcription antitermination protein NusB
MRRRKAREFALQILFSLENQDSETLGPQELDREISSYLKNFAPSTYETSVDTDYLVRLLRGICEDLSEIDTNLEKYSDNWKLYRMSRIDRNILRIGAQELKHFKDIPPRVTMDECVELAKKYGTEDSSAFVNGILDRIHTNSPRKNEQ